jgi:hypothetical protein
MGEKGEIMETEKKEQPRYQIRFKECTVKLTNQSIIELAYLTMEALEALIESGQKVFVEQANCYLGCFYTCQRLLKAVDPEYLDYHSDVKDFFREGRELSNDGNRLSWDSGSEADDDPDTLF